VAAIIWLSAKREPASPIRDITKSDGRAMAAYQQRA
jgi:hypothetical protein